jgi:putative phosphoesterase
MMRVAVLGDIHGNLRAMEAVLADARTNDVEQFIFLGDLVYNGLDPQHCYDALMAVKPMVCIKGNSDGYLEDIPTFTVNNENDKQLLKFYKYTSIRMLEDAKASVAEFLPVKRFDLEGVTFLACHGSPYSDTEGLYATEPFDPVLAKKLANEKVDVVLCAHTHVPADFNRNGIRFINPGAVGFSLDGDTRASWALLTIEKGVMTVKIKRVEYDINRYKAEVEHAIQSFPLFSGLLHALENGRMPKE